MVRLLFCPSWMRLVLFSSLLALLDASSCLPSSATAAFLSNPRPLADASKVAMHLYNVVGGSTSDYYRTSVSLDLSGSGAVQQVSATNVLSRTSQYVPFVGSTTVSAGTTNDTVQVSLGTRNATVLVPHGSYQLGFGSSDWERVFVFASQGSSLVVYITTFTANAAVVQPLTVTVPSTVQLGSDVSGVYISINQNVVVLPANSTSIPCLDSIWLHFTESGGAVVNVSYLGSNGFARNQQWVEQYVDTTGAFTGVRYWPLSSPQQVTVVSETQTAINALVVQYGLSDPCSSSPCANGGTCTADLNSAHNYSCTCTFPFTGPLCTLGKAYTSSDVVSTVNVQVIVAVNYQALTWEQFASVVAPAMGLHRSMVLLVNISQSTSSDQTKVVFQVVQAGNVQVMRKVEALQAEIMGGNATLTDLLPLMEARLIAPQFEIVQAGFPAWLIVGVVIMVLLSLVCIKCEW